MNGHLETVTVTRRGQKFLPPGNIESVGAFFQCAPQPAGPEGLVYYELTSNMLLLHMPEVQIFPPQLNTTFNYVEPSASSESDELYRFGYWNEDLKEEWIREADYLLIPGQFIDEWQPRIDSSELNEVMVTSPYESCRAALTTVHILEVNE